MRKRSIIGIIVIAVAASVIITTYTDSSSYGSFYDAEKAGAELHVVGTLDKRKRIIYEPLKNANLFAFYMVDKEGQTRRVIFNGAKPQDFERSEQIVLIGKMNKHEFHATKILMKCPSKYTQTQIEAKPAKRSTIKTSY